MMPIISRAAPEQPFAIACSDCKMCWRVENITVFTMGTLKLHCPACGSSNVKYSSDYANDRWYSMAATFGLARSHNSVELLKGMWDLWDPKEHELFRDFVLEYITDFLEEQKEAK